MISSWIGDSFGEGPTKRETILNWCCSLCPHPSGPSQLKHHCIKERPLYICRQGRVFPRWSTGTVSALWCPHTPSPVFHVSCGLLAHLTVVVVPGLSTVPASYRCSLLHSPQNWTEEWVEEFGLLREGELRVWSPRSSKGFFAAYTGET